MTTLVRSGASETAEFVANQVAAPRESLHQSQALGIEQVIRGDLADVWEECRQPHWDGYNALPVSASTLAWARRFLMALPPGAKAPSIGALPDGSITFEWHQSRRRSLTVSLTNEGELHYAALVGAGNTRGTEVFIDEVPATILALIGRVYSC